MARSSSLQSARDGDVLCLGIELGDALIVALAIALESQSASALHPFPESRLSFSEIALGEVDFPIPIAVVNAQNRHLWSFHCVREERHFQNEINPFTINLISQRLVFFLLPQQFLCLYPTTPILFK